MALDLVIPPCIDDGAPGGVLQLAREAAALSKDAQLKVQVTAGDEAANTRRFTLQVTNRRGKPCIGLFALLVVVGTTAAGGPGGGQTVSLVTGAAVQTIAVNQAFLYFTDAGGKVVLDLTIAGAATLFVRAGVAAIMFGTDGVAWV